ncbi:hypothetical protein Belba_0938 [Belliella baltica DSM 15883]|uniref:Uncharacterized protein n=1 Tax=Belliella baltica (strain DSM 15883 / CIP 108006 / LMG 21964 / BA134) TaxID=866536 RepID=I3Z2W3_BELBD|nr:hypothetical protein [Belliella baltica]AFL83581.1 hypothetical protein Belba_0938 [Belliella baltica DSM 15883]
MKSISDKRKDGSSEYVRKEVDFLFEMAPSEHSRFTESAKGYRVLIVLKSQDEIEKQKSYFNKVLGNAITLHVIHAPQFLGNSYTAHFDLIIFQNQSNKSVHCFDAEVLIPNGTSENFKS